MSVKFHNYLIAHQDPLNSQPLTTPVVVATITCDPRFTGKLNPHKELTTFAAKMGLLDFEITTAEAQDQPGHQLSLPFPPQRKRGLR